MEKNIRAFFYEYKYYLFPDDCESVEELISRSPVAVRRLKEENCMAPDFIYESIAEETLDIIQPQHLFELNVNLYSAEEYDAILTKEVEARCLNCARFVNDDEPLDLTGHYREMSLNGVCYEREEEDDCWSFAVCTDIFWRRIAKFHLSELADCIEKNDNKKLNKILNAELSAFCFPFDFYGLMQNGCYHLYFSVVEKTSFASIVAAYLSAAAAVKDSAMGQSGWIVHPFVPADTVVPKSKFASRKVICAQSESGDPNKFIFKVYSPHAKNLNEKKSDKILTETMKYVSALIGEEVFRTVVEGLYVTDEKENAVNVEEAAEKIRQAYLALNLFDEAGKAVFPPPLTYGSYCGNEEQLPFKNLIEEGYTCVPEIALADRVESEERQWWMDIASYAYVYVPRLLRGEDAPMETLAWYMSHSDMVPQPLRDPHDTTVKAMGIGLADCGEHGFILDNLVFDEKKWFRGIRMLAPVLRAYGAKMVVVNGQGIMVYSCNYDLDPADASNYN